jgi:putative NIF3 family GTP cyclohydrolase 1 type 2
MRIEGGQGICLWWQALACEVWQNERMDITRRSLLIGGAALAASSRAQGFSEIGGGGVSAAEVVARIKGRVGIPWMTETVDRIVAGNAEVQVKGIATTMMATLDVIQRAVAAGNNMIITHEPTFYSHQDATEALRTDPTFQFKTKFIGEHDVAVFRFHDHWHRMKPDGINFGMTRELGWEKNVSADNAWRFAFPEMPLGEFVDAMATRLKAHSMRVVGDARLPIRKVATSWGYASLMPDLIKIAANPDVDLMIMGETREWELVEYVQDQIASGAKKALIVLNHVVSEQAGMKYCVNWLKTFVPEVPISFVAAREPFWVPRSTG